ncbi:MAG: hypothetical protein PVJ04_09885 [Gemmatimonadota bacterium]
MKRVFALATIPLLGCASSGGEAGLLGTPQVRTVVAGSVSPDGGGMGVGAMSITYLVEPVLVSSVVPATPDVVWPLLLDALASEGLSPDGVDATTGLVSVGRVEWSRERNGLPLSTFLDCGISATGRSLADDARIVAAMTTQAEADGTEDTRVTIRLEAVAFPLGESGERARECRTNQELEHAILGHIERATIPAPAAGEVRATTPGVASAGPTRTAPTLMTDLPFSPGDKVRIWLSDSERITGAFLGFQADALLLKKSRRTHVPFWSIDAIQVKHTHQLPIVLGSVLGIAAGITVATTTEMGIGGRHAVQGEILNPGLGAVVGGLVGAAVGYILGTSWIDVPLDTVWPDPALER